MKTLVTALALSLIAMSAQARPANCYGQEGSVGQIVVDLQGTNITVQGAFGFTEDPKKVMRQLSCTGHLANGGQNGLATHDYYELHGNCGVQFLRTEKDQSGRLTGWVSLVRRNGGGTEDWSGYQYNFFLCQ